MTYEHYDGVGFFDTHLLDGAALLRLALDLDHSQTVSYKRHLFPNTCLISAYLISRH